MLKVTQLGEWAEQGFGDKQPGVRICALSLHYVLARQRPLLRWHTEPRLASVSTPVILPVPALLIQLTCRAPGSLLISLLRGIKWHPAPNFPPYSTGNLSRYLDTKRRHPGWGTTSFFSSIPTPFPSTWHKMPVQTFYFKCSPHCFSHSLFARSTNSINLTEAIFLFPSSPPTTPYDKTWKQHDL